MQGRAATCCVHLPGPNHLQPEWEWAVPTFGPRTGIAVLRRWTDPEVTSICTHTRSKHVLKCMKIVYLIRHLQCQFVSVCVSFLSTAPCCYSSKGEECDDMNSMNGDGCSTLCKKEPFFNCVGKSNKDEDDFPQVRMLVDAGQLMWELLSCAEKKLI